jgi:nucleoside-diphosphate-sugar epimerase
MRHRNLFITGGTGYPRRALIPRLLNRGHIVCALVPFHKICEWTAATREGATRLGLVTLKEMAAALVRAVECPVTGVSIVDVPGIREAGRLRTD